MAVVIGHCQLVGTGRWKRNGAGASGRDDGNRFGVQEPVQPAAPAQCGEGISGMAACPGGLDIILPGKIEVMCIRVPVKGAISGQSGEVSGMIFWAFHEWGSQGSAAAGHTDRATVFIPPQDGLARRPTASTQTVCESVAPGESSRFNVSGT